MSFSLGVWAQGTVAGGTLYRWEADQKSGGSGYVVFDSAAGTVRPSDGEGAPIGDLIADRASGELRGSADGIDRPGFVQTAVEIFRASAKVGEDPSRRVRSYRQARGRYRLLLLSGRSQLRNMSAVQYSYGDEKQSPACNLPERSPCKLHV